MRRYQLAADIFDDAVAARLGLNRTDLRCVDILDQRAPMTAGALAPAARLSPGAVTFVRDRREAAGFVRRGRDPGDRRRVLVEVVSAGMRKAEEMHVPMILDARKRLSGFSEDELATVRRFLCISAEIFERNVPE
jgi:DNA-binding MarR family transcriptional regulator